MGITQFAAQNFARQLSCDRQFDARSVSTSSKLIECRSQASAQTISVPHSSAIVLVYCDALRRRRLQELDRSPEPP
ncbi:MULTISPECIES: hypothetical protein [unclassified Microcoleus]|uniref:hypothetical protein n=1 Tax=unclassified Microcoleus TaxID=2642155 RepID=UPI002FCF6A02